MKRKMMNNMNEEINNMLIKRKIENNMKIEEKVRKNLLAAIENKDSYYVDEADEGLKPKRFEPIKDVTKIPTLEKGVYRDMTRMLKVRFEMFGRWTIATHGNWLGIDDMEALWEDDPQDEFLEEIKESVEADKDGWLDHAASLFQGNRLSLFARSEDDNESIYLLWLENADEPEFWVYDENGESRYLDLNEYLIHIINDDLSSSDEHWALWHKYDEEND